MTNKEEEKNKKETERKTRPHNWRKDNKTTDYNEEEPQMIDIIKQANNQLNIQNQNIQTIIIIATITIIAIIIGFYIYNKQMKKKGQTIEEKKKQIKEIIKELKNLEKEITINNESKKTISLKRIYLDELPEEINKELTDKGHILNKIFTPGNEKDQPWLILIRNTGKIEIKKNVKEGLIEIETNDKDKSKKYILISPNKRHDLTIGKNNIKMYVAHEDEAECYPLEKKHYSRAMFEIIQNILLNRTGLIPKAKKISKKMIIIIIAIIIISIIGYWAYTTYFLHPTTTQAAITTINQTINNTINTTTNEGIKVVTIG